MRSLLKLSSRPFYKATNAFFLLFCTLTGSAQTLKYDVAQKPWPAAFGNHRAIININKPADAVRIKITWRLHDQQPEKKRFLIINAANGDTIQNVYRVSVDNEQCDIVFGPTVNKGIYYFYYLPYKPDPDPGYYHYDYLSPALPDMNWVANNHLSEKNSLPGIPMATCTQMESRTGFDSFYPMEIIPTATEKKNFLSANTGNYILFPEDRKYPIRMKDNIPLMWLKEGPQKEFKGVAAKNEYFTFQVGLYSVRSNVDSVQVSFSEMKSAGHTIPSSAFTCFNTGGINSYGKPFTKRVDVAEGNVQALWMGVDIPANAAPGVYKGAVLISTLGTKAKRIPLQITVTEKYLADRGDNESWRYSRLRWLNSTTGISDRPTAPFTNISSDGSNDFSLYGKQIKMASNEMPASIKVWGTQILAAPIKYVAEGQNFTEEKSDLLEKNNGRVNNTWSSFSKDFELRGNRSLEFDGYIHYTIHLRALHDVNLKDFRLEIPLKKEVAQYMMGMGLPGTFVPDSLDAKWKGPHDSFWMGNTYRGIYCKFPDSAYHGPLLNLYHPSPPESWYNNDKGGFSVRQNKDTVTAIVYSGDRDFKANEEVTFEFYFIITPIKKLDTKAQFTQRYFHDAGNPWPDSNAVDAGIKVVNIHQGNSFNPYINYPFLVNKKIKYFSDYWHRKGMKVKIYYTIRELTNHTPEIWALLSLNHEVLSSGDGGGYPWLREHLIDDYTSAWYTPIVGDIGNIDAALESAPGDSRWYNFYIRGLAWLIKNEDIDGLYLDDVSYGRHIIKRMRETMDSIKPGCLIDLHSNTGFSIGPATQYTAFFPYINKLWFGESFQYDKMPPANWLVECAGIPFGLMGDMLQGGGNPWRGMVYGMTARLPWATDGVVCNPKEIWKVWDSFGIADSKMIGYWDTNAVVKTSDTNILATAYIRKGKTLISIASWAPTKENVRLKVDWKAIGLNPDKVELIAPAINSFQPKAIFSPADSIPVEPTKGWLLIAEEKKN